MFILRLIQNVFFMVTFTMFIAVNQGLNAAKSCIDRVFGLFSGSVSTIFNLLSFTLYVFGLGLFFQAIQCYDVSGYCPASLFILSGILIIQFLWLAMPPWRYTLGYIHGVATAIYEEILGWFTSDPA